MWWPFRARKPRDVDAEPDDDRTERAQITRLQNSIARQRAVFLQKKLERMKALQEQQMLEEQIAEMEEDLRGPDEDDEPDEVNSPEALLYGLLTKAMFNAPKKDAAPIYPGENGKQNVSDEELRRMRDSIPEPYLKKLRKMGDAEIVEAIRISQPDFFNRVDDDTLKRVVVLVKQ